jgi:hypothetical protein
MSVQSRMVLFGERSCLRSSGYEGEPVAGAVWFVFSLLRRVPRRHIVAVTLRFDISDDKTLNTNRIVADH